MYNQIRLFCLLQHMAKNIIHQVTTMLATSKNVLFPGPNHLQGADDPSLKLSPSLHISTGG